MKVFGINVTLNKQLTITGYFDNVITNDYVEMFISKKRSTFLKTVLDEQFIRSLNLKDYILLSPPLFINAINETKQWITDSKAKSISVLMKEFLSGDLYLKRSMILKFATYSKNSPENKHYALFLFELLSNDYNGFTTALSSENIYLNRSDQAIVFDSMPFWIQESFCEFVSQTQSLSASTTTTSEHKLSYEQQINLMKVDNSVKEKAFAKLKELKSKAEESAFKSKQYLEGLLNIPFKVFREEQYYQV